MPTNRRRRNRFRQAVNGLPEVAFQFFGDGPFFEAEDFEKQTTEAARDALWREHRESIIDRYRGEHPERNDLKTWGEVLEDMKGAAIGNK